MKERIKNVLKDRKFQIGVVVGMTIVFLDANWNSYSLAREGFKRVKPIGCNASGTMLFEDVTGRVFEAKDIYA